MDRHEGKNRGGAVTPSSCPQGSRFLSVLWLHQLPLPMQTQWHLAERASVQAAQVDRSRSRAQQNKGLTACGAAGISLIQEPDSPLSLCLPSSGHCLKGSIRVSLYEYQGPLPSCHPLLLSQKA